MGEQDEAAGGLPGFALDKDFLRSPKGVLMEAELVTERDPPLLSSASPPSLRPLPPLPLSPLLQAALFFLDSFPAR